VLAAEPLSITAGAAEDVLPHAASAPALAHAAHTSKGLRGLSRLMRSDNLMRPAAPATRIIIHPNP
jgi:hypothetical protein